MKKSIKILLAGAVLFLLASCGPNHGSNDGAAGRTGKYDNHNVLESDTSGRSDR